MKDDTLKSRTKEGGTLLEGWKARDKRTGENGNEEKK